jgi:hypothetical protein
MCFVSDGVEAVPLLDIGRALDLLAASAGDTSACADVSLDSLRAHDMRELYRQGRLPVRLTLGALVVLDAAQRSQQAGCSPTEALDCAINVAVRFFDLMPAAAFDMKTNEALTSAVAVDPGNAEPICEW